MIEITEKNCNYHLTRLYRERDQISEAISRLIGEGRDTSLLEKEYDQTCKMIEPFLEFRKSHYCLLEGDSGYGPV